MLKEHPDLRRILIVCGTTEAALELFAFYMPIHGHSIGLSASSIGMIMGAYAVAMIVIRPLVYGGLGPLLGAIPIFWACAAVLVGGNTLVPAQQRRVLLQRFWAAAKRQYR